MNIFDFLKVKAKEKPIRFCIDCKHCLEYESDRNCTHKNSTYFDVVTGEKHHASCSHMRNNDCYCGVAGKFFEKK